MRQILPTALHARAEGSIARRHTRVALAVILVTVVGCKGPTDANTHFPNGCALCPPPSPPAPGPPPATHHQVVRGVIRDPSGAPVPGAFALIDVASPSAIRHQTPPGGEVGADGKFEFYYTVGFGSASPESVAVRAGGYRWKGPMIFVPIPTPKPLSVRPDTIAVVIVLPP